MARDKLSALLPFVASWAFIKKRSGIAAWTQKEYHAKVGKLQEELRQREMQLEDLRFVLDRLPSPFQELSLSALRRQLERELRARRDLMDYPSIVRRLERRIVFLDRLLRIWALIRH